MSFENIFHSQNTVKMQKLVIVFVVIFSQAFQEGSAILVSKIAAIKLKLKVCFQTKMNCRTSENSTCIEPFCYVTPVDNKTAAANFGCKMLSRPLNQIKVRIKITKIILIYLLKFQVKQEFYFKFFKDFIPFNIFPEIEFCSFVKTPNRLSYFNSILEFLKRSKPDLIHQCPYQDMDLQIKNLTPTVSDLSLWITGEYKLVYTIYDDNDPQILQVSARGIIKRE